MGYIKITEHDEDEWRYVEKIMKDDYCGIPESDEEESEYLKKLKLGVN